MIFFFPTSAPKKDSLQ